MKRYVIEVLRTAYIDTDEISSIYDGTYEDMGDIVYVSLNNGHIYSTQYFNINFVVNSSEGRQWYDLFTKFTDKWKKNKK